MVLPRAPGALVYASSTGCPPPRSADSRWRSCWLCCSPSCWWPGCGSAATPNTCRASCATRSCTTTRTSRSKKRCRRIARDYYRPVQSSTLDNGSIAGAVASLNDRFSHYLAPKEFGEFNAPPHFAGIGVVVDPLPKGLLIGRVFDSSPASRAGLKPGELIVGVDGRTLDRREPDKATEMIKGPPGTDVKLQVESRKAPHGGTAHGADHARDHLRAGRRLGDENGRRQEARRGRARDLQPRRARRSARGRRTRSARRRAGDRARPARQRRRPGRRGAADREHLHREGHDRLHARAHPALADADARSAARSPASIPMVVLVDSNTASAAEIVTAALQDHRRATVVGTHTFGKGVFQEEEPLSNGGALDITVGEYFTPNGRNLGGGGVKQGAGITPEVQGRKGRRRAARARRRAGNAARRKSGEPPGPREPMVAVLAAAGASWWPSRCSSRGRGWIAGRCAQAASWSARAGLAARAAGARATATSCSCVAAGAAAPRRGCVRRIGRPDVARDVIEALMLERGLRARVQPHGRARGRRGRRAA